MKRFGISFSVGLILCWASASYARASGEHVVFINPGKHGEVFWELVSETMTAAAAQLDIQLEILWSERNRTTMQNLGVDVTERAEKPDFMIIVNEENAAAPILQAADRAGIPTFFLLNPISNADIATMSRNEQTITHMVGSLQPDIFGAGQRMAERLIQAARANKRESQDGKLHILALAGDQLTPTSVARTNGFLSYVKDRSDVVVDRLLYSNWNRTDATTLSYRYLEWAGSQGITPAGIWAANDPIAFGAIDAIEQMGLSAGKDIPVVGLNWSGEAIDLIKKDKLLLSEGGHFFGGAWSMVILRDLFSGCHFDGEGKPGKINIHFPLSGIDKSANRQLISILSDKSFSRIQFSTFLSHGRNCGTYDFSAAALVRAVPPIAGRP